MSGAAASTPVRAALWTPRFESPRLVAKGATLVLTERALLVARDRLLGAPKLNVTISLKDVKSSGCGPLHGVGPTWQVVCNLRSGEYATVYALDPPDAERFHDELREAVGLVLREESDPEFAKLRRALALARAQPDGTVGESMTTEEIVQESRWMRGEYDRGSLAAVWERRVQLGYGISGDHLPQPDFFHLNALPAAAALRLGLREHPVVAMCCGFAEQCVDRNDPDQLSLVADLNRMYFEKDDAGG